MPKIPLLDEGQVLNASSPVPIAGTGDARIQGEAIASAGKGLANLGISMIDFEARTRDNTSKIQVEEAFTKAREKVYKNLKVAEDTYANNPDSDGINIYDAFMKPLRDDFQQLSMGIDDPLQRRHFMAKADQYAQNFGQDLGALQRQRRIQNLGLQINDTVNTKIGMVRSAPQFRDQGIVESTAFIKSIGDDLVPADKKEAYLRNLPAQFDSAVIDGHMERQEFDAAREYLKKDAVAQNFDRKTLDKMFDSIDAEENKAILKDRASYSFERKVIKNQERDIQDKNDSRILEEVFSPAADIKQKKAALDEMRSLVAQRLASPSALRIAEKFENNVSTDRSDGTEFRFMDRITLKKDMRNFESDVVSAVENNELSSKAGIRVLARYRAAIKEPKKKDDLAIAYEQFVRAPFKTTITDDPTKIRELKASEASAVIDYKKNIRAGQPPELAARNALVAKGKTQYTGVFSNVPEQYINDTGAIDTSLKQLLQARAKAEKENNKNVMSEIDTKITVLSSQKKVLQNQQQLDKYIKDANPKPKAEPSVWQRLFNFGAGQ